MGAEQSSTQDSPAPPPAASKVCYYELLGVERTASEDEIRKAYRRKALELHPDRNYNDVDNATRKFAEIQSAYEVLSDAQERAWYDSHRDIILRGEDPAEDRPAAHNANVTAAQDLLSLLGRFNSSTPFTDEPQGFFGTIRKTFAQLADEENAAAYEQGLDPLDYPDFGMADDDFNSVVKPFYSFWLGFGTQKSFAWKDRFRYSDAPDRKIRRLMEKENKRYRDEGIREFNEAVRTVVSFVRSRDPRYLRNAKSDAERQQDLRKASAAQAARSRAANRAKDAEYVPSAWTQTEGPEEQVGSFSESEESVVEHIECVICDKIFKSEKQYEMHEKSKKHIKAVQQLKRQMQKENKSLNLDIESVPPSPPPPIEDNEAVVEDTVPESEPVDVQEDIASTESELDDDYAPREEVQTRILGKTNTHEDLSLAVENISLTDTLTDTPTTGEPRVGKAKAKRAKKAARLEQEIQTGQQHKCATCNEAFSSKSKLFDHIRDLDHAQMVPRGMAKSNKARKKR